MSTSPLDPLPDDLAALFAREARAHPDDSTLHAAVLGHLEWASGLAAPLAVHAASATAGAGVTSAGAAGSAKSAAASAAATGAAGKLVAVAVSALVVAGALGGVVGRASINLPPPQAPTSIAASHTEPIVAPKADWQAVPAPSVPVEPSPLPMAHTVAMAPPPAVAPSASSPSEGAAHGGDLTREREVLEVARAALASGRANDAIATIERHVQKWPRGYLAEEREVLWIQALVLSGRRDEAFAKATLFRKTYPTSILQPAIEAALSPTQ